MFDVHDIIARNGVEGARRLARTKHERVCVEAAAAVRASLAQGSSEIGYAALGCICLPHKNPDRTASATRWRCQVDDLAIELESGTYPDGEPIGLPYGSKARIIQIYMTTKAMQSDTPEVPIGPSMYGWVRAMTGQVGGGMTYRMFAEQARRLAATTITATAYEEGKPIALRGRGVEALVLAGGDDRAAPLYLSRVNGPEFPTRALIEPRFWRAAKSQGHAIQLAALAQIYNNSFAIDLYVWLTHRLARLETSQSVPWAELTQMFGSGFRHARQMKPTFLKALDMALAVYPSAVVEVDDAGLTLHPSAPPVEARPG